MASLVKPIVVRYLDAEGRQVPKGTPGARVAKERAAKWYGVGVPGWPRGKRVPLSTHKATAQSLLNKLVQDAQLGRAGLNDAYAEHRERPLTDVRKDPATGAERDEGHLGDYRRDLEAKGRTPKHCRQAYSRVRALLDGCGAKYPADLSASAATIWLAGEREAGRIGVQTSNYYLRDAKSFLAWLVKDRRLPDNPFEYLEGGNAQADRRHDRRELEPHELAAVLDAAMASTKTFRRMTGRDRYHAYLTACATGFRAEELASLTPESFRLDATPPVVTLGARLTKNRKTATQPLPSGVVPALREYLATRPPGEQLWPGAWSYKAAEMLRIDLEAAGVPYVVQGADGPLFADFHALRHSFITLMEQSGISVKHAQELARHSDVRLTLQRYTHARLNALAESVELLKLPALAAAGDQAGMVPLSRMSRPELEALTAGLLDLTRLLLAFSVVAPVAINFAPPGDYGGQVGTDRAGQQGAA
jgi:integrase